MKHTSMSQRIADNRMEDLLTAQAKMQEGIAHLRQSKALDETAIAQMEAASVAVLERQLEALFEARAA